MMPVFRLLIPALAMAALGACERDQPAATRASAEGEILEGSVSDAMLPLDTVRSQPPLAPRSETSGAAESKGEGRRAAGATRERDSAPAEAIDAPVEAPAVVEEATPAEE